MKILVVAEQQNGTLHRASWEAIAAAQTTGQPVTVVVFGSSAHAASASTELKAADVSEVLAAGNPALEAYTADGFTAAAAAVIGDVSPTHVVFAHTYQTRDYAPRLAARLDRAIATDVVAVKEGPVYVRPMFQNKVNADVVLEGPAPHLVTL